MPPAGNRKISGYPPREAIFVVLLRKTTGAQKHSPTLGVRSLYLPPGGRGTAQRWMRNGVHFRTAQSFNRRTAFDFPRRDTRPRVSAGIPGGMPLRHRPALPHNPKSAHNLRIPGFTFPRGEGGPRSGG